MADLLLLYRATGAETRDDYLRSLAHENGLPLDCVRAIAALLGEREDFRALVKISEERGCATATCPLEEAVQATVNV